MNFQANGLIQYLPRQLDVLRSAWLASCRPSSWIPSRSMTASAEQISEAGQLGSAQASGIADALQRLQSPIKLATRIASLAAMSALYRDIQLTAQSIHKRQVHGSLNPLVEDIGSMGKGTAASGSPTSFPMNDTSKLSDTAIPSGMQLDQRHMDKITCWAALQPNHMETSHMLLTGINLFPPQEATYPTYVDFDAVVKGLEQRKSRKRIKLLRKLRTRQDKYQLKVWDHYPGHQ